jgi:hypothetical protein
MLTLIVAMESFQQGLKLPLRSRLSSSALQLWRSCSPPPINSLTCKAASRQAQEFPRSCIIGRASTLTIIPFHLVLFHMDSVKNSFVSDLAHGISLQIGCRVAQNKTSELLSLFRPCLLRLDWLSVPTLLLLAPFSSAVKESFLAALQ